MSHKYQPIVGLEIHLQVKTKSKMFCRCDANYFGDAPNTHVCPVCMGFPGALPVPNKAALEQCIRLALALNCKINQHSKFDRKNYFYPDLPKGYQISQYDLPVGYDGYLEFDIAGDARRVRIKRVHMEEDTAKSLHTDTETLVDFNKSGIPVIEVVTEPDFENVEEVLQFSRRLKQTVQFLGVSDADMEKGQMRFELNISLRKPGESGLPDYRIEVKNIGSISVLEKVISYEAERQSKILDAGEKPQQETRGLVGMTGETTGQRSKEGAADYRYFPEPDIPLLEFSDEQISRLKGSLVELPMQVRDRYIHQYKLEPDTVETLIHSKLRVDWFDKLIELVVAQVNNSQEQLTIIKESAKWLIGDVFGLKQMHKVPFRELPVQQQDLIDLVTKIASREISGTIAKQVLEVIFTSGGRAAQIIVDKNWQLESDADAIAKVADEVIAEQTEVVADYAKNPNAIKFLVGQVMRKTKGKANPTVAQQILEEKLQ